MLQPASESVYTPLLFTWLDGGKKPGKKSDVDPDEKPAKKTPAKKTAAKKAAAKKPAGKSPRKR